MATLPRIQVPDSSYEQRRGDIIAGGIQQMGRILANTTASAIQQYQQDRTLKTAYKGVRGMVLDRQDQYGLNDAQADALMTKLKYRDGESITAYEKRIAPTLNNMMLYEEYLKSSDYQIKMPDPFLDNQVFKTAMDINLEKRKQRELGIVSEGFEGAKTKEDALEMVGGRMAGRAVSEEELKQFPGYRALPTQAGVAKEGRAQEAHDVNVTGRVAQTKATTGQERRGEEMHPLDMQHKRAQINAMKALEKQREASTSAKAKKLAADQNKGAGVNKIKSITEIARMEIATTELLKDMEKIDPNTGEISEDYINMKELSQLLAQKRKEAAKVPETSTGSKIIANQIQKAVELETQGMGGVEANERSLSMASQQLQDYAKSLGVSLSFAKIKNHLMIKNPDTGKNYTVEEIAQEIENMGNFMKQRGGRVGQ